MIAEDNKDHRPTQIEKKHTGGLREEIMKRRQQNKCPKSAFENFSEKDILVSKVKIKEQIDQVTKTINKKSKPKTEENEKKEEDDILNMVTEMQNVIWSL